VTNVPARMRARIKGTQIYVDQGARGMVASAAYDAAGSGPRLARWRPGSTGPNAALGGSLTTLRNRSRDKARQDGIAAAGVASLTANIVGTGIVPQFTTADADFNRQLSELWLEWTDAADADERLDFYGLQALAVRSMIEGGDCFARLRVRFPEDGLPVPMQVQLLEAEYCPESKTEMLPGGRRIVQGVEFDAIGRRAAYWLTRGHPLDGLATAQWSNEPMRISGTEVAHLAVITRPGQIRGEPWLTRALVKLHDFDSYDDAQLLRQKIATLWGGFVRTGIGLDGEPIPGTVPSAEAGTGVAPLEAGMMQVMAPGETVEFAAPPSPGDSYGEFMRQQLRGIAVAIGCLYEQLTGDYSTVNERTYRAALNEFRRRCATWQHHNVVYQFCRPVMNRWAQLGVLSGAIKPPRGITVAQIARARWVPEGWPYLNPTQDVQARRDEVRAGFRSRADVVAERGYDVAQVDAELAADNARSDELGLMLDSDPRRVSQAGLTQARTAGTEFIDPAATA